MPENEASVTQQIVDWDDIMEYFGYESPREAQNDSMQKVADTVGQGGFFVLEGACGTGKTMLALSPLISLVRSDKTNYDRIVVVTSVKQQQRAFEDDLRQINKNLSEDEPPVSGLTLVGKSDLNPYIKHGGDITDEGVYEFSERLRENTRKLIDTADNPKSKADELVNLAENLISKKDWPDEAPDYPYAPVVPATENGTEFDPFYAKHVSESFEDSDTATIPYDVRTEGLVSPPELMEKAGRRGQDPHAAMGDAMEHVEVVIANYYHIFEPTTVQQLTRDILGEDTLLVADEAHNLVPRVRELLCDELSAVSIPRAQKEMEQVRQLAETNLDHLEQLKGVDLNQDWRKDQFADDAVETAEAVQSRVNDSNFIVEDVEEYIEFAEFIKKALDQVDDITLEGLESYSTFLDEVLNVVDKKVTEKLNEEYGNYWEPEPTDKLEVPLREPDTPSEDGITQYMSLAGKIGEMKKSSLYGSFMTQCFEHFHSDIRESEITPTVYSSAVGRIMSEWEGRDHSTFYRQIEIEGRWDDDKESTETGHEWEKMFNVSLNLKNCIPSDRLAERLGDFGGGVFMSATLEPMDVFEQVSGIKNLEKDGRPVVEQRYGLGFPEPNRESFAVEAPAFKYSNKNDPYDYADNPSTNGNVRSAYSKIIKDVAKTTEGNVLIVMPSYEEARWAGDILRDSKEVSKPILTDESSKDEETEELKQRFFRGGPKVLTTGALGTLVEGVDYKGDKLSGVLVCGVPLENTYEPYKQAIKAAYNERFDEDGFEYAFTIPAVRKARQSIGRVIRTDDDLGVRVLADERYTSRQRWDSVRKWLPENERDEFETVDLKSLENRLDAFWRYQEQFGDSQ